MKARKPERSRIRTIFHVVRGISFAVLMLGGMWSGVFWGYAAVTGTAGGAGHQYVKELLELLCTLALLSATIYVFTSLSKNKRNEIFVVLSDAMKRIASGDFAVEVPVNDEHGPLKPVAASLNQMVESLRQIEQMRQEFISDVSHEIQSPLTSIAGFAAELRKPDLTDVQRAGYIEIIESESRRLSRLSDNLLKLTSLESNAQNIEASRYRIDQQIRSAVLACEPQWGAKALEVEAELPPVWITADREMLDQVWMNLLGNAVKFTPKRGRISVDMACSNGTVTVNVRDSGIGVSAEDLPHLFDRFFKADKARTNSDGGSGLGLAIVMKVVSRLGGTAEAKSDGIGTGTCITVVLPGGEAEPVAETKENAYRHAVDI